MTSWITDRVVTDAGTEPKELKKKSISKKKKKNDIQQTSDKNYIRSQKNPGSSLIRRARLIRRRTTGKYCENMRINTDDETPIITQILCLKLKKYSEAKNDEILMLNGIKSQFIPYIEFSYPQISSINDYKFPPPLFYPDFTQNPYIKPQGDKICPYTVVLTDEKGNRTFAYCFKYQLKINYDDKKSDQKLECNPLNYGVVVLTTLYPVETLLKSMVEDLIRNIRRDPNCLPNLCSDIMNLRLTSNFDAIKSSTFVVSNHRGDMFITNNIVDLLEKIGVENTIYVFLSLLAEKRVIITGNDVVEITGAVQGFIRLLLPLEWPHTLIPIVPDTHVDLAYNPTPYIIGIMRYNLNKLKDIICPIPENEESEDVIIIDLERGVILPSLPLEAIKNPETKTKALINAGRQMGFPKRTTLELLQMLKHLFIKKFSKEKLRYKIERKIMVWYAQLFGHYRLFMKDTNLLTAKNKKRFANIHPEPEVREFLQWFIESGIFQAFLYSEKDTVKYKNSTIKMFNDVLDKHSPPLRGKGKRNKARTLVWRLFHK